MMPSHILIIDDDAAVTHLARALLTDEGYDVTVTSQPAEARDILHARRVDAALFDLSGPLTAELIVELRDRQPDAVVFLFTARSRREAEAFLNGLPVRNVGLILKPFDVDEFLETLADALDDPAPSDELPV